MHNIWCYGHAGVKEISGREKESNSINLSITSICSETQNFKESLWISEHLKIDTEKLKYSKLYVVKDIWWNGRQLYEVKDLEMI